MCFSRGLLPVYHKYATITDHYEKVIKLNVLSRRHASHHSSHAGSHLWAVGAVTWQRDGRGVV